MIYTPKEEGKTEAELKEDLDFWNSEPIPEVFTTKFENGKFVTEGYLEED